MRILSKMAGLIVLLIMVSCNFFHHGYKYNKGWLPETPVNLTEFNTEFDDYNSTSPTLGSSFPFCFSTNRNSYGDNFDIICQPMNVVFDKNTGELNVYPLYDNVPFQMAPYEIIQIGAGKTRTAANELGPYLMITPDSTDETIYTLLYSSDVSGNFQINFVSNATNEMFSEPKEVEFLNSEFDDMYPTFNTEKSRIYFCSNRNDERFHIFYVDVTPTIDLDSLLSDHSNYEVMKEESLSSDSDDKCPFIFENEFKMVFASNRPGGFGGFDLYYSKFENGKWSDPVNFGEPINSEFDEYRPILIDERVSDSQTMMVFSSNRPGGLGGFDLYFVGVSNE